LSGEEPRLRGPYAAQLLDFEWRVRQDSNLQPSDPKPAFYRSILHAISFALAYEINRDHPLVRQALNSSTDHAPLNTLLRMIEETVPIPLITITDRERPDQTLGTSG
jgi:hypothetical protein